ncbi:YjeF family domain-containing protein [Cyphellophora europaea CBS 101466]|uniref:NAD(P)H-hydrate epimerase n=1 Tax=Cyphellophora europaea (strain CBS 101466) TaxID=1220924 RepID=W2RTQ7_CYPE1|nr:YjeF family domain-containing protein [Cyphellophora europaea CBS 101466]ETN39827.1 YjeF family domain-containing protein [Cyphellophora europaea CBS 101466]
MTLKTLTAESAANLDKELMSPEMGFSIDQLMELAGLSVAQAIHKVHPPSKGANVLLACGPGNNGGDGLVAARHLYHFGYKPSVFYPKPTNQPIFQGLQKQLKALRIPFVDDFTAALKETDLVVDALFGFSFKPPVREPFDKVLEAVIAAKKEVLSVDIPSSWHVEEGPPKEGELGAKFMPEYLISLTAPKPCVQWFKGKRHFVGGRFLGQEFAEKFGLDVPAYEGVEQVAELEVGAKVEKL